MRRGPAGAVQSQVAAGAAAAGKNLAHLLLPSLCVCVSFFFSVAIASDQLFFSTCLAWHRCFPVLDAKRWHAENKTCMCGECQLLTLSNGDTPSVPNYMPFDFFLPQIWAFILLKNLSKISVFCCSLLCQYKFFRNNFKFDYVWTIFLNRLVVKLGVRKFKDL